MTLDPIIAPQLARHPHGFFTRKGGASSGVFAGLNCGLGSSDQREAVLLNRARVSDAMGAPLVGVHQVHSADVVTVTGPDDHGQRADALVTATPGVALVVLTADCQPVLFSDANAGVVGAAHGGWRGTLAGVLDATVDAMEALGAQRSNISAVVGPTISQRAYEVGPELMDNLLTQDAGHSRFFQPGDGDRLQFDLPGYGLARLRDAGVGQAHWTGHCTYSDPERFYSYRRATHQGDADYGRLIAAIRL